MQLSGPESAPPRPERRRNNAMRDGYCVVSRPIGINELADDANGYR